MPKKEKEIKVQNTLELPITEKTKIVVSTMEIEGEKRLDIRVYVSGSNYVGPTQKGINIPIEKSEELINAIKQLAGK